MIIRIVIIDDELIICNGISHLVNKYSTDIKIVGIYSDPEEALELCNWGIVDLILMDINMPGLNGFQLLQKIQTLEYNPLFLVITGHAKFEFARKALRKNAVDFILKPIVPARLYEALDKVQLLLEDKEKKQFLTSNKEYITYSKFAEFLFDTVNYSEKQIDNLIDNLQLQDDTYILELLYQEQEFPFQIKKIQNNALVLSFLVGTNIYAILIISKVKNDHSIINSINENAKVTYSKTKFSSEYVSMDIKEIHALFMNALKDLSKRLDQKIIKEDINLKIMNENKSYSLPIDRAIKIIYKSFDTPLSLSNIANTLELHPTYLSNLFKKETKHTFVEFLNTYRIERAKELLKDPLAKIWWVSESVGFADQKYFSLVFKRITGFTPLQYRTNYYFNNF